MIVSSVDGSTAALTASSAGQSSSVADMQDQFLTLLVTQMQYQDPLDPMDNAEITMQLAQMSTVEGINGLNSSLESLLASYQTSATLQAASLIGHAVLVDGNELILAEGAGVGGAALSGPADWVSVSIYDAKGQLVQKLELGPQEGNAQFVWDGKDLAGNQLPDGLYTFTIDATQAGKAVSSSPVTISTVSSVAMQDGVVTLELFGLGERALDEVQQIF